jgi:hypothetical protein
MYISAIYHTFPFLYVSSIQDGVNAHITVVVTKHVVSSLSTIDDTTSRVWGLIKYIQEGVRAYTI